LAGLTDGERITKQGGDSRTGDGPAWLQAGPDGLALELHVQPGARRTAIVGEHGGRLKVAVNAPPLDGRANDAVLQFVSEQLGVPRRAVTLEAGASGRDKRLRIGGALSPEDAARRLLAPQKRKRAG
jgi:hypothetical protein